MTTLTVPNIHQRMLAVYEAVGTIQKEDKKVNNQYTFVSHDAVMRALHDPLVKNGICLEVSTEECEQDGNRTKILMLIKFVNADNPSNFIEVKSYGYGIDPQDKGVGKAVSYAFKMALLKNFCLESCDDDNEKSSIEYKSPSTLAKKNIEPKIFISPPQVKTVREVLNNSGMLEKDFLEKVKLSDLRFLELSRYEGAMAYLKQSTQDSSLNG